MLALWANPAYNFPPIFLGCRGIFVTFPPSRGFSRAAPADFGVFCPGPLLKMKKAASATAKNAQKIVEAITNMAIFWSANPRETAK